jgi:hypothetical protein
LDLLGLKAREAGAAVPEVAVPGLVAAPNPVLALREGS